MGNGQDSSVTGQGTDGQTSTPPAIPHRKLDIRTGRVDMDNDLVDIYLDNVPVGAVIRITVPGYPECEISRSPNNVGVYGGDTRAFSF